MNYASSANIEEVMKFYNLGHETFETDFKLFQQQNVKFNVASFREETTDYFVHTVIAPPQHTGQPIVEHFGFLYTGLCCSHIF